MSFTSHHKNWLHLPSSWVSSEHSGLLWRCSGPYPLPGEVHSHECLDSCGCPLEDQTVNVMSTFVGMHGLQVHGTSDQDTSQKSPPSQHVSSMAGDVQGLPTVTPFQLRDHFWDDLVLILQAANCRLAWRPGVMALSLSYSFFWISQVLQGLSKMSNCILLGVYCRAVWTLNSAAPSTSQAMPFQALFR